MANPAAFTGSVPRNYHDFLGPLIFEDYARDLAARAGPLGAQRILELACGTGIVTRELVKTLREGASLLATDLNPAMLEVAKSIAGGVGSDPRMRFESVDACTLPYGDGAFDLLACQYGVMFFPDKAGSMKEARRVLKPGGRYIFNVWDSLEHNPIPRVVHETLGEMFSANPPQFLSQAPYGWSNRAEIERTVRSGGFTNVTIETVKFPSVGHTAQDVARGWVEGTPLFSALQERGVKDFAPVREAVAKALAERFGAEPCRSTMQALVVTAG